MSQSGGASFDASMENASELRLGRLENALCVSNAVIWRVLERSKASYEQSKHQFPPIMESVRKYVQEVAQESFPRANEDESQIQSLHKRLEDLKFTKPAEVQAGGSAEGEGAGEKEEVQKLHQFEISALVNLMPRDDNEMIDLVPSLDRLSAEEQRKVLTVLKEEVQQ